MVQPGDQPGARRPWPGPPLCPRRLAQRSAGGIGQGRRRRLGRARPSAVPPTRASARLEHRSLPWRRDFESLDFGLHGHHDQRRCTNGEGVSGNGSTGTRRVWVRQCTSSSSGPAGRRGAWLLSQRGSQGPGLRLHSHRRARSARYPELFLFYGLCRDR